MTNAVDALIQESELCFQQSIQSCDSLLDQLKQLKQQCCSQSTDSPEVSDTQSTALLTQTAQAQTAVAQARTQSVDGAMQSDRRENDN